MVLYIKNKLNRVSYYWYNIIIQKREKKQCASYTPQQGASNIDFSFCPVAMDACKKGQQD